MILTVDVGNTNIKIGGFDNEKLVFIARLYTNIFKTSDEYTIQLHDILRINRCNSSQFDGAIISSVVPPLSDVIKKAVSDLINKKRVLLISPGIKTGLNIKIDNPAILGSDMVCAAVAAVSKYPLPCIVVSLGTATAIFAIDKDGAFLGCTLHPGIAISLEVLAGKTAQLPHLSLASPSKVIGTNSADSIRSGIVYGTASMIDGVVQRMQEEMGCTQSIIGTGGYMEEIIPHCKSEIITDENIVFEGLKIIYHKN